MNENTENLGIEMNGGKELTPEEVAELELKLKQMHIANAAKLFKGGFSKVGTSKIGITRKNKKLSHKKEKIAKKSRKISRGKS